jgi:hypothetical protein
MTLTATLVCLQPFAVLTGSHGSPDLEPTHWELDPTKQFYSRHFKFTKKSSMVTCKVLQTHRVRVRSPTYAPSHLPN